MIASVGSLKLHQISFLCTLSYGISTLLVYVVGLFNESYLPYHMESEGTETPTLTEMTRAAIEMLQKEAYGYVLLVEGNAKFIKVIIDD